VKEILPQEYGRLVPPNQPQALSEAVLDFAEADFSARKDELHAMVEKRFSWDVNVQSLKELYEELI
jgi:glycosyltransferase involved in cell wall biosynthesis